MWKEDEIDADKYIARSEGSVTDCQLSTGGLIPLPSVLFVIRHIEIIAWVERSARFDGNTPATPKSGARFAFSGFETVGIETLRISQVPNLVKSNGRGAYGQQFKKQE